MTDPREKSIRTRDGLTLRTEAFGPAGGPPLLLVMGAMNPGLFWPRAFCERLATAGFLVIRYDHRDTGGSSTVDYAAHPYTLTELTDDALAILDGYRITRADVMGLSMGGYIAQLLAIHHPARVANLVLLSTTADPRPYMAATTGGDASGFALPPPTAAYLAQVAIARTTLPTSREAALWMILDGWRATHGGSLPFPEDETMALIREGAALVRDPFAAFHHAAAVATSTPWIDQLDRITARTLVIHGRADPCLPLAHGEYLAAHIRGAKLVTFDMGHMFPLVLAGEISDLVGMFVAGR